MGMLALREPAACPACGGTTILRICYGVPNDEAWALVRAGRGTLGGCFMTPWLPDWECGACRHRWFDPDDPVKQGMERDLDALVSRHARRRSGANKGQRPKAADD